ncbi:MAG: hypothetical protein MHMPM18_000590 [Marteilia pararefringens]
MEDGRLEMNHSTVDELKMISEILWLTTGGFTMRYRVLYFIHKFLDPLIEEIKSNRNLGLLLSKKFDRSKRLTVINEIIKFFEKLLLKNFLKKCCVDSKTIDWSYLESFEKNN